MALQSFIAKILKDVLNKYLCQKRKNEEDDDLEECPICYVELDKEKVVTECGHSFCAVCLLKELVFYIKVENQFMKIFFAFKTV